MPRNGAERDNWVDTASLNDTTVHAPVGVNIWSQAKVKDEWEKRNHLSQDSSRFGKQANERLTKQNGWEGRENVTIYARSVQRLRLRLQDLRLQLYQIRTIFVTQDMQTGTRMRSSSHRRLQWGTQQHAPSLHVM